MLQIKSEIDSLGSRWYKLLFVCSEKQNNKGMAKQLNIPYMNLNLLLSEKLKDIPKSKYAFQVSDIIESILKENPSDTYWLGDIEILFDRQLQQNPVRLLEQFGKRYKLVVSWPGECDGNNLTYATPEHPEFFTCHETDGKILKV